MKAYLFLVFSCEILTSVADKHPPEPELFLLTSFLLGPFHSNVCGPSVVRLSFVCFRRPPLLHISLLYLLDFAQDHHSQRSFLHTARYDLFCLFSTVMITVKLLNL